MKAQLAEPVDRSTLDRYVRDDRWVMSQKVDGVRLLVSVEDGKVRLLNRKGDPLTKAVPPGIARQAAQLPGSWCLDGELFDGTLYVFDLPSAGNTIDPSDPYEVRRHALERIFEVWQPTGIVLLPVARTPEQKAQLVANVEAAAGEGVMLNDADARYRPGQRSRAVLKVKFWNSCDCFVTAVRLNGKDNMSLAVFDEHGTERKVAECTALAGDGGRIQVGDVVEVKYLYAVDRQQPRLVQPTYPKIRTDKDAAECLLDQLHFTNKMILPPVKA